MNTIVQDLDPQSKIPEAYKSGFSFFLKGGQKYIAQYTAVELALVINQDPRDIAKYVHELWRTGRMEVVYNFFMLPDYMKDEEMREDDVIFHTACMMKDGNVPLEEARAFINDLVCASQNAHDGQSFGEEPLNQELITDRVERILVGVSTTMEELRASDML